MNGTDWPSPAAILPSLESEMKEILAVAGVKFPGSCFGNFTSSFQFLLVHCAMMLVREIEPFSNPHVSRTTFNTRMQFFVLNLILTSRVFITNILRDVLILYIYI